MVRLETLSNSLFQRPQLFWSCNILVFDPLVFINTNIVFSPLIDSPILSLLSKHLAVFLHAK